MQGKRKSQADEAEQAAASGYGAEWCAVIIRIVHPCMIILY